MSVIFDLFHESYGGKQATAGSAAGAGVEHGSGIRLMHARSCRDRDRGRDGGSMAGLLLRSLP